MGNCNFKTESTEQSSTLSVNNFVFHYVIGRGGFGKVWRVEKKSSKTIYAMKEMSKARVITKKSVSSVMNERHLLSILKHPFLVNMVYAFQDRDNLYLLMDIMPGGDLRHHIGRRKKFTEEQTKFFIACMIIALEYIHNQGILHRDIKPENLVFDAQSYLRVTDLGIARVWRPDNSADTSGTPGYMAPEIMCRQNHGVAVDYYAIGVIAYECMMGKRPYVGRDRKEIRDQILAKQVQLKKTDIPQGWSLEAADFINRLIQRKPMNRLGVNGPQEVKSHPWFKDYPWEKLLNKELRSPFLINEEEMGLKQGISNCNFDDENTDVFKQNAILLRRNSIQGLFTGYHYDANAITMNPATSASGKMSARQSMSNNTTLTNSFANQTTQLLSL
jgi:serine/threonine kinase 32